MNMPLSLEISSTMKNSTIKQPMDQDIYLTSSPKQLNEWSIPTSFSQLKLNNLVLHEDILSVVTFVCSQYVVVTPKGMQFGVLVYPNNLNRVRIQLPLSAET